MDQKMLFGKFIRLEPLSSSHIPALVKAAIGNQELYKWTFVPQGLNEMDAYVQKAIEGAKQREAFAFAIVDTRTNEVVGSTRFWNMQIWDWPEGHSRFKRKFPDVCEIGHTWLSADAIRTPVNTEAKLLLLTDAFDRWNVLRVCFQTDERNLRSRAAIERIGGKFEGIVRAERLGSDYSSRNTARYSIITDEWFEIKRAIHQMMDKLNG